MSLLHQPTKSPPESLREVTHFPICLTCCGSEQDRPGFVEVFECVIIHDYLL